MAHIPFTNRPSSRALWLGLVSGPVIWTVQFLTVYLLVEVACRSGILLGEALGLRVISLLVVGLSLVALGVVVYAAIFSYGNFQEAGGRYLFRRENLDTSAARFMAIAGLTLNLIFALLIFLSAIPAVFLDPCVM